MPVFLLSEELSSIGRFDVFGQRSGALRAFICHTGLSGDACSVSGLDPIFAVHMRPPLESQGRCYIDLYGRLEDITDDERLSIDCFIEELQEEYEAQRQRDGERDHYIIHPHTNEVLANNGTLLFTQYSCAGFVMAAYEQIGVSLLCTEESVLPEIDWLDMIRLYHDLDGVEQATRVRLGLEGDGPWRIVLPGYLFHSLQRDTTTIRNEPYEPCAADRLYPEDDSAG